MIPRRLGAERAVSMPDGVAQTNGGIGPLTILLVDDDEAVRGPLLASLQRAGHEVLAASDGPEALSMLGRAGNKIQMLITDVEMPAMSGIELASLITRFCPGCPVLLISGGTLPSDGEARGWKFLA